MWQPIETVPKDGTVVIFANFFSRCLLTGAPHVWTGRYEDFGHGRPEMAGCSYAATNQNGEPTHWMSLPPFPADFTPPPCRPPTRS